jgi:hypothetical protein
LNVFVSGNFFLKVVFMISTTHAHLPLRAALHNRTKVICAFW